MTTIPSAPTGEQKLDAVIAIYRRNRLKLEACSGVLRTAVALPPGGDPVIRCDVTAYAVLPAEVDGVPLVKHVVPIPAYTWGGPPP